MDQIAERFAEGAGTHRIFSSSLLPKRARRLFPNCAQLSHPPTHWQILFTRPTLRLLRNRFPVTCQEPKRGPSDSLYLSLGERPRMPFTARIERAQFHRARSASKKGTWPLSSILLRARVARARGATSLPSSASYGIMPPFGDQHGAFARIRRFRAYLSWTVPRESDCLVFEADGDRMPDRPEGLSVERRRGEW